MNAQRLDHEIVFENVMAMEKRETKKKVMAGNSNDAMVKWKKKEKTGKEDNKTQ